MTTKKEAWKKRGRSTVGPFSWRLFFSLFRTSQSDSLSSRAKFTAWSRVSEEKRGAKREGERAFSPCVKVGGEN
jgi:hypothetical protein